MITPYQNVAKEALINWNGLSEEEATTKINTESVEQLEGQVYALDSVKYAVIGLAKQINLEEEKTIDFFDAVVNGPTDAQIFVDVKNKSQGLSEEKQLEILATIHDGWVKNNANEKTFNKKVDRQQLRQYAPIDLIGWNEVRNDLLFLKPILASVGVQVNEQQLSQTYHERVNQYMTKNKINSQEDLTALVQQGKLYYPTLPEELETRLKPMSNIVSAQIVDNWNRKDPETAKIMQAKAQVQQVTKN